MNKLFFSLALVALAACSSSPPHYEKMRTADDALNSYDQNMLKDGMAITKKGAVVDIKTEEVQAEKNRLLLENEEKDKKIENLHDKVRELEQDVMQLRVALGLSPKKPKTQGQCCTSDGKMIPGTIKAAPSLQEELSAIKPRKGASYSSDEEMQSDSESEN